MDFNRSGRVETELHSDFRVQAYLCCDRAVQRGQDLINTLNQAAESYAHRLREGEGEGGREAKTGRREEGEQVTRRELGMGGRWKAPQCCVEIRSPVNMCVPLSLGLERVQNRRQQ